MFLFFLYISHEITKVRVEKTHKLNNNNHHHNKTFRSDIYNTFNLNKGLYSMWILKFIKPFELVICKVALKKNAKAYTQKIGHCFQKLIL